MKYELIQLGLLVGVTVICGIGVMVVSDTIGFEMDKLAILFGFISFGILALIDAIGLLIFKILNVE